MAATAQCTFDPETHTYWIDGRVVPSVTQVLRDLLPGWQASDWHLQRGRAVHACAAMIARGQRFTHDPRITGQVKAARAFFNECRPTIYAVETPVYSIPYQYAGTPDLVCKFEQKMAVVDFKASLSDTIPLQCAAYALPEAGIGFGSWYGLGVELREDGTYSLSERYPLKRYAQEWLALLTTYKIRQRLEIQGGVHDATNGG